VCGLLPIFQYHIGVSVSLVGVPLVCAESSRVRHTHAQAAQARNHKSCFRSAFHRFFSPVGSLGTCLLCTLLLLGWPAAHRLASTVGGFLSTFLWPILRSIFPSLEGVRDGDAMMMPSLPPASRAIDSWQTKAVRPSNRSRFLSRAVIWPRFFPRACPSYHEQAVTVHYAGSG
jgi:hypothetical protein